MSLYSSLTQVLAPFAAKINGLLTGWDGTRYSTPGEAVRQQIADLHVLIGDEPGTAIQSSAVAYGESDVETALDGVNGRIGNLQTNLNDISGTTENVFDMSVFDGVEGVTKDENGYYTGQCSAFANAFSNGFPNLSLKSTSRYYFSVVAYCDANEMTGNSLRFSFTYSDANNQNKSLPVTQTTPTKAELISMSNKTLTGFRVATAANGALVWHIKDIMLIESDVAVDYYPHTTAYDRKARKDNDVLSGYIFTDILTNWTPGYIDANGSIHTAGATSKEVYSDFLSVYRISGSVDYGSTVATWIVVAGYDKDKAFIDRTVLVAGSQEESTFDYVVPSSYKFIRITYRSYSDTPDMKLNGVFNVNVMSAALGQIDVNATEIAKAKYSILNASNPFIHQRYYDHTMIDKVNGVNVVIPSESIYNVQLSKRLGFDIIEGNVRRTSDGKYIVMHGERKNGNTCFGAQVEHIDGVTDVSSDPIASWTLADIQTYLRYKSIYPKYRTAICSLEEWLCEVVNQKLFPFIQVPDSTANDIIISYMGKDNYIAYAGTRNLTNGMIYIWDSETTKAGIVAKCDSYGAPLMYGCSDPTQFTDAEITEIIGALHEKGYLFGFASTYVSEVETQRLFKLGADFSASKYQVNDFDSGNIANLIGEFDYTEFTTTGTDNSGLLTLDTDETIAPAETYDTVPVGKGVLHILFEGTIRITMGSYIDSVVESDGAVANMFSTYFMNEPPTFTIKSTVDGTTIKNIVYKASKC